MYAVFAVMPHSEAPPHETRVLINFFQTFSAFFLIITADLSRAVEAE